MVTHNVKPHTTRESTASTLGGETSTLGEARGDPLQSARGSSLPEEGAVAVSAADRDAMEAREDFRSIFGEVIYRHHVRLRKQLYAPKESSFPMRVKFIDVVRQKPTWTPSKRGSSMMHGTLMKIQLSRNIGADLRASVSSTNAHPKVIHG